MQRSLATGLPIVLNSFEIDLGDLIEKYKTIGVDALIEGLDLFILNLSFKQDSDEVRAGLSVPPGHS